MCCVCVCERAHAHVCGNMCASESVCMRVHAHVCVSLYTCVCVCVCVCGCVCARA